MCRPDDFPPFLPENDPPASMTISLWSETDARVTVADIAGYIETDPMPIVEALRKLHDWRARYRTSIVSLAFADCRHCDGTGTDEGQRCNLCEEREEALYDKETP